MAIKNIPQSEDVNQNKENSGNQELLHREQIPNTPFELIGNNETGYWIAFGKYRLTQPIPLQQPMDFKVENIYIWTANIILINNMWNIILNLISIFSEYTKIDIIDFLQEEKPHNQNQTQLE